MPRGRTPSGSIACPALLSSNPACQDSLYLGLRTKPFNTLTRENLALLIQRDSMCAQAVADTPILPMVKKAETDSNPAPKLMLPVAPDEADGKPFSGRNASQATASSSPTGLLLAAGAGAGFVGVLLLTNATTKQEKTRVVPAGPCFQIWGDLCEDRPETVTETYTETRTDGTAMLLGSVLMVTSLGLMIGGLSAAVAYHPSEPPQHLAFALEDWRMGIRYTLAL